MAEINFLLKKEIKIRFRTQADFSEVVREHESVVSAVVNGRRRLPKGYKGRPLHYWLIYEVLFVMVTACYGKLA
jgi:hypothetical protein